MIDTGINVNEVRKLRDNLIDGCQVTTPYGRCKLIEKFPYMARTEKGCFKWIEIYLAERGIRCIDREKEVKIIPKGVSNAE